MKTLDTIIAKAKLTGYCLPGNPDVDRYVVAVSGGGDSTSLAILINRLFPNQEIEYVFTDTHAESDALYENLDRLEQFLGINITRISHEKGLYGLIDTYGGFLPSMRARFCTKDLKILPYQKWVRSIIEDGQVLHSFVGIRADEEQRHGLVTSNKQLVSHFPFQSLGVYRSDVFQILKETVGVPSFYAGRTRSGCSVCPFMRKSELLATLRWEPSAFEKASQCEKLSEYDRIRFDNYTLSVTEETRLASNHVTLPFPARIDSRTADTALPVLWPKMPSKKTISDLFDVGTETLPILWVGAEFFVNPAVGDHGVWWQEMVAISTTRHGLMRQMANHYQHRLNVPEVRDLDIETMKDELKLAIYMVELPPSSVDTSKPGEDSYTWQSGMALSQMKQHNEAVLRTLHITGLDQEIADYKDAPELTWQCERREGLLKERAKITDPYGKVLAMDLLEIVAAKQQVEQSDIIPLLAAQQGDLFGEIASAFNA